MPLNDRTSNQGGNGAAEGAVAVQDAPAASGAVVSNSFFPSGPGAAASVTSSAAEISREYHKLLDVVGTPNYETIHCLFEGNGVPPASTVPSIQVSFELFEAVQSRFAATRQVLERTKADLLTRNQHYSTLKQDMMRLQDEFTALQRRNVETEERNTQLNQQRAKLEVAVEQLGREVGQGRAALDALRSKLLTREEELQLSQSRVAEGLVLLSQKEVVIGKLRHEVGKFWPLHSGSAAASWDYTRDDGGAVKTASGHYTADMLNSITADVDGRSKETRMKLGMTDLETRLSHVSEERDSILAQHTEYRRHVQTTLEFYESEAMLREDTMGQHHCVYTPYYAGESHDFYSERVNVQTGELWTTPAEDRSGTAAESEKSKQLPPNFNTLTSEIRRLIDRLSKVHIDDDSQLQPDLLLCVDAQHMALKASAGLAEFLSSMEDEVLKNRMTLAEFREEWRKARVPDFAQAILQSVQGSASQFSKALVSLLQHENRFMAELDEARTSEQQPPAEASTTGREVEDVATADNNTASPTSGKKSKQTQGKRGRRKSGARRLDPASASGRSARSSLSSMQLAGGEKARAKSLTRDGSALVARASIVTPAPQDTGSRERMQVSTPITSEAAHASLTRRSSFDQSNTTSKEEKNVDSTNESDGSEIFSVEATTHDVASSGTKRQSARGDGRDRRRPLATAEDGGGDPLSKASGSEAVAGKKGAGGVTRSLHGTRGDPPKASKTGVDHHAGSPSAAVQSKVLPKRTTRAAVAGEISKKTPKGHSPNSRGGVSPSKPSLPASTGRSEPQPASKLGKKSKPGKASSSMLVLDEQSIDNDLSRSDVDSEPSEGEEALVEELQFALSECQDRLSRTTQELQDMQAVNAALKAQLSSALAVSTASGSKSLPSSTPTPVPTSIPPSVPLPLGSPSPSLSAGKAVGPDGGTKKSVPVGSVAASSEIIESNLAAARATTGMYDVVGHSLQRGVRSQQPTTSTSSHSSRGVGGTGSSATEKELLLSNRSVGVQSSTPSVRNDPYARGSTNAPDTLLQHSLQASTSEVGGVPVGTGERTKEKVGYATNRQVLSPSPVSLSMFWGSASTAGSQSAPQGGTPAGAAPITTSNPSLSRPEGSFASRVSMSHSQHSKWVLSDGALSSPVLSEQDDVLQQQTAMRRAVSSSLLDCRPETLKEATPPTTVPVLHRPTALPPTTVSCAPPPKATTVNAVTTGGPASIAVQGRGDNHPPRQGGNLATFKSLSAALNQHPSGFPSGVPASLQPLSTTEKLSQSNTGGYYRPLSRGVSSQEPTFSPSPFQPMPALPAIALSEEIHVYHSAEAFLSATSTAATEMQVCGSNIFPSSQSRPWTSVAPQDSSPRRSSVVMSVALSSAITPGTREGSAHASHPSGNDFSVPQAAMAPFPRQGVETAYQPHQFLFPHGALPLFIHTGRARTMTNAEIYRSLCQAKRRDGGSLNSAGRSSAIGGLCHLMTRAIRGAWMHTRVNDALTVASPPSVRTHRANTCSSTLGKRNTAASYVPTPRKAVGHIDMPTEAGMQGQWPQLLSNAPLPALLMYLATPAETRRRWGSSHRTGVGANRSMFSVEALRRLLPRSLRHCLPRVWEQQQLHIGQIGDRRIPDTHASQCTSLSECVRHSPTFGRAKLLPLVPARPQHSTSLSLSTPSVSQTAFGSLVISPLPIYPRKDRRHLRPVRQWAKRDPVQRAVKRRVYTVSAASSPISRVPGDP